MVPRLGLSVLLLYVFVCCSPVFAGELPADIPFKVYEGFAIVVRGSIGDQENLNFLVDTGAVPSVVNQSLARKLNLTGSREEIMAVTQSASVRRVVLPRLRMGFVDVKLLSVVVLDLTPIEARLKTRLDAIIGLDAFGHHDLTIDYRKRRMRIGIAEPGDQTIPFELRERVNAPYVVIPVQIDAQPLLLLLDTGTDGLTLFTAQLGARESRYDRRTGGGAVNARGTQRFQRVEHVSLRLGGRLFGIQSALATAAPEAPIFPDFDGMLGPACLGVLRIAISFRTNSVSLEFER
jgi:predicted aspartyl protease